MIRVERAPEPPSFNAKVRKRGQRLLKELRGDPAAPKRRGPKRSPVARITPEMLAPYWTECLDDLAEAFHHACAYCCIRVDPVTGDRTVDHFTPKREDPDVAYEWENFRFASRTMNCRKERAAQVCDPFTIQDGWFVLNLLTFGLKPNPTLPPPTRALVQATIDALELDGEAMRRRREEAWNKYDQDRSPRGFRLMEEDCPLVAKEYVRQRGAPPFAPSAQGTPPRPKHSS